MAPEPPETPAEVRPGLVTAPRPDDSDDDIDMEIDADEEERGAYEGYEPLALAPPEEGELRMWNSSLMSSDESEEEPETVVENANTTDSGHVPFIETVEREVTRELWTTPRENVNIQMDPERAQQVMSAMANFSLPSTSIPEWAHTITEDEWRQQLAKRINISNDKR